MASVADRVEDAGEAVVKGMECIGFRLCPCDPFIDRAVSDPDVAFGFVALSSVLAARRAG